VALDKADGSYTTLMKKLLKTHLLLLDDFGLAPMADSERRNLLEVIEDRHGHPSTIMASQLPVEHWHESIGDRTLADAILDRLIHNIHRINLKEGSMRKNVKLTEIVFCVKDLSTPALLRSDKGWLVSVGTSGRFGAEQLPEFSGMGI
jgi:DNA replication protein DnaC